MNMSYSFIIISAAKKGPSHDRWKEVEILYSINPLIINSVSFILLGRLTGFPFSSVVLGRVHLLYHLSLLPKVGASFMGTDMKGMR